MPTVLPWSGESPLVALAVVLALAAWVGLSVWVWQAALRFARRRREEAEGAGRVLSPRTWLHLERGFGWLVVALTAYVFLYASTWVWSPMRGIAFDPAVGYLPSLAAGGAILLGAALALDVVAQVARYAAGELHRKPARPLNAQVVAVVHLFLRYVTWLAAGLGLLVVAFTAVGYEDRVLAAVGAWLTAQAGALLLLAVLVLVGWAGGRMIKAVTHDLRFTSRRLAPEVVDAMGAASRGALYAFLGILGVFTVLSVFGLGSIGGTMIVVLSTFIGLVVAMAATGSIGNALSGLVLIAFKPFSRGDRVVVGDLVCDVDEISVMFTRVHTIHGEVVEIPNNLVLQGRIKNLSRSGEHATVVRMGIGYDVPHVRVRELAVRAALATDGVLKDPPPRLEAVELGNFAIQYELSAYTRNPRHREIRSDLLGNLQDVFREGGVEILTPDVRVIRDQPQTTVRVPVAAKPAGAPDAGAGGASPAPTDA